MEPFLKIGDEVLVDVTAYADQPPQKGDVVVARHPYERDTLIIKRVVAVGSDGRCAVQGDNPTMSTDSRSFGSIEVSRIIGRITSQFG